MPINIAPTIEFAQVPRSPAFAAELDHAEFVLIPACMSRITDAALRDPILMASAHLANNITKLKAGLEAGLSDEALSIPYEQYLLFLDAVNHWTNAPAGIRFPEGEAASEEPQA